MKMRELRKQIYLVDDFWSSLRCDEYVSKTEAIGYQPAKVQTENGPRVVDFVRNNNRVIYKDFELANSLWTEVKDFAPKQIGESVAIGLNELFRFYRYKSGQQFRRHRDQSYMRSNGEASYYTFMIYLNDDFEGGETTFNDLIVRPKKGSALIFYHYLEHEGTAVLQGTKYVLRTDIMFKLKDKIAK